MANVGYATLQIIPSVRGIGDDLRRQLVGPAGDAGDDAGDAAGGGFRDAFTGALAAIGLTEIASTIGEQFTEAFNQSLEQANVKATLQNQLGSSGKTAANQGAAVGKLFSQGVTGEFEQGAEAIRAVVSGGLAPPDATVKQLTVIGTKMTDVANSFGTDMGLQSQAVSAILKNHLAPDATAALDLITVGFQKLGPNAEDLLETFQEYPVQLKKLGLDAKTSMGLFQQGLQGGARDTDIVADSLKEFSIRAIDMSSTSQTAYKQLGLSAKDMSLQISKGGKGASDGLQTVLDKLRGIKDPVARNAAAVGLFGTQAEELGTALFKLDPGKATRTFSDVGGAADKLGETFRSGPSYQITLFKRTMQQGLVNFIGGKVLPVLSAWGGTLNAEVLPPLVTVGGILSSLFLPALSLTGDVLGGTIGWFEKWGIWLAPLAILIGGVTVALSAQAIASGLSTAALWAQVTALTVAEAVTGAFAATMGVLDAVMALNPFVLVAIALIALGAALFIAYKKSETFRGIVTGVWSAVQAGWQVLWSFLKPGVDAFMVGLRAIGDAATWLWQTVLSPVFGFIGLASRILATVLVVLLVAPAVVAFKLLAAIGLWLWQTVLSPVFHGIGDLALWLYASVIKPTGASIVAVFRGLGDVGMWLWKTTLSPVFHGIGDLAIWLYAHGVKPSIALVVASFHTLAAAGTWLWKTALSPVFHGIGDLASWLYDKGIKPPIDKAKGAASAMGRAFTAAKDVIGKEFGKIGDLAKTPIAFVINTVYNKGIVGVWNKVASAFGAPALKTFKGFDRGGILPGRSTFRQGDDQLRPMRRGEGVYVSEAMRDPYERARLHAVNSAAMSGRSLAGFQGGGYAKGGIVGDGFSKGGIFGWVGNAASKGVDLAKSGVSWLKDGMKASAVAGLNKVVQPLISRISGSASLYRDMVTRIPKKMISSIVGYSGAADSKMAQAGIGGARFRAGLAWARTQAGKAYQWGGNGDPSWDCSGLVSAVESVIRGESPHRRWATGAFSGATAPPGWVRGAVSPYRIGITNSGVGHTAGTINGVNIESRGGDGVVVGSRARAWNNNLFTDTYGLKGYAAGTRSALPGWSWVGERGPELLNLRGGESIATNRASMAAQAAAALASASASSPALGPGRTAAVPGGLLPGQAVTLVVKDGPTLAAYVDGRADGRVSDSYQQLVQVLAAGGGN